MTAKYCAIYLHGNILSDPEFSKENYDRAIVNGFLKTDIDLKSSMCSPRTYSHRTYIFLDPEYEKDHSGCTAVCALVTKENALYVVCYVNFLKVYFTY
jgi:hypothetical protein